MINNREKNIQIISEMYEEKHPSFIPIEKYNDLIDELEFLDSQYDELEKEYEEELKILQDVIDEKEERIQELIGE